LDRRLGELQSWSGCRGEERNSQPLPGLKPPIIHPIAQRYTCELFQHILKLLKNTYFHISFSDPVKLMELHIQPFSEKVPHLCSSSF
jgi:hypothetical protein